jgi:hypothetical protein
MGKQPESESLTVRDNRTGKSYNVPYVMALLSSLGVHYNGLA